MPRIIPYLILSKFKRFALIAIVFTLYFILNTLFFDYNSSSDGSSLIPSSLSFKSTALKILDIYKTLSDEASNWKMTKGFIHHHLELNPKDYLELRSKYHHHDPRISLAAASSYLSTSDTLELPFSWQDWVDLAPLNPYVGMARDQRPNCAHFVKDGLKYAAGTGQKTNTENSYDQYYCLDDSNFLQSDRGQYYDPNLLPGFNFQHWMSAKKTYPEKLIFAKSHVLSGLEIPSNLYFLGDDNKYIQVKPIIGQSMAQSGLLKNYFDSLQISQDGNVEINPISAFQRFVDSTPGISHIKPGTEISLTKDDFIVDLNYTSNNEKFLESIEFSQFTKGKSVPKYFHEVNINFPAKYNGHRLLEDGGHYDYRFFSGFSTEMPESIHKPHSPEYPVDRYEYPEKPSKDVKKYDSSHKRRRIIISHMIHTLLTFGYQSNHQIILAHGSLLSWYFNGLAFPWDNDADVQMPINQMMSFCNQFNQSMIFENPKHGMGKYFLDCSSYLTQREKNNGNNNIDARFIDIDSGFFVDITGLAISGEKLKRNDWSKLNSWLPNADYNKYPTVKQKHAPLIKGAEIEKLEDKINGNEEDENNPRVRRRPKASSSQNSGVEFYNFNLENGVINCRNRHFYVIDHLKDLKLTKFENAPIWIPQDSNYLESILADEYGAKAITNPAFQEYLFIKELKIWVPAISVFLGCKNVALEKSPLADISNVIEARPVAGKRGGTKKNYDGSHLMKCLNHDRNAVINQMLNIGLGEIVQDNEPAQADLRSEFSKIKLKLASNVKINYVNVFEELFNVKDSVLAHESYMKEQHPKWIWGDNHLAQAQAQIEPIIDSSVSIDEQVKGKNDITQPIPPLRHPMLDYLIEIDRLNELL